MQLCHNELRQSSNPLLMRIVFVGKHYSPRDVGKLYSNLLQEFRHVAALM